MTFRLWRCFLTVLSSLQHKHKSHDPSIKSDSGLVTLAMFTASHPSMTLQLTRRELLLTKLVTPLEWSELNLNLIVISSILGFELYFYFRHDFDEKHGGSKSKCNGNGLMSYNEDRPNAWTSCNNQDFEDWYRKKGWTCLPGHGKLSCGGVKIPKVNQPTL